MINSYAFGMKPVKGGLLDFFKTEHKFGKTYNNKDELKKANLQKIAKIKLEKLGIEWPVYISRTPVADPKTGKITIEEETAKKLEEFKQLKGYYSDDEILN